MSSRYAGPGSLHFVATAVLTVGLSACCPDLEDVTVKSDHNGIAAASRLMKLKAENETDEARCEAGCRAFVEEDEELIVDEVLACTATGVVEVDDPWAAANEKVMISCTVQRTEPGGGFCTGRRPQKHREVTTDVVSVGSWLAVHAHLERASVLAFEELAAWLQGRDAPEELVDRCRYAAEDEVRHAELMGNLAHREGAPVPEVVCGVAGDDVFEVAVHNAVEGCVREAFAAIVAAYQARRAAPEFRSTFQSIAADELRHGQLAWDLHHWLLAQLPPSRRAAVQDAQAEAMAELASVCADNARRTPARLGWPSPPRAAAMARSFCALMPVLA